METGHLNSESNWLISKRIDLTLLFLPIWLLWIIIFKFSDSIQGIDLPLWAWVVFILGFDVSHVWSSLFRTYLDKEEFNANKKGLILSPIIALSISIILLSYSIQSFWRIMAYVAVFHFIKQQYGFVALYLVKQGKNKIKRFISDKGIIYLATIYPILFWHFNSNSEINWFVENDFFKLYHITNNEEFISTVFQYFNWIYWAIILCWFVQELAIFIKYKSISLGKIAWVITTAFNWWLGIVYFNSDVIFSVTNVIAHGLPYIVLVYYYRRKKAEIIEGKQLSFIRKFKWLITLLFTIIIFAIIEEYFWDMLVNRDKTLFFEFILPYNWYQIMDKWPLIFAIAILALPQQVHYLVDGFIWKFNDKNKYLKMIFNSKDES